jgi:16S rRNA (cytidine1402-2'-O)-methyltransferase
MLYLVATPIGNLADISARALDVLSNVSVLACEDTRRTRILYSHHKLKWPSRVISYREHAELSGGRKILSELDSGLDVALCSDGGMPSISDPGYRIVNMALDAGIEVTVIPGSSAVETGLAISGLSTSSYVFKGFPPRKGGPLKRFFSDDADSEHTMVIFESPYRIKKTIACALEVLGDRRCAVCFELTKLHERVHRGYLSDVVESLEKDPLKGEITAVIAGNNPKFTRALDS